MRSIKLTFALNSACSVCVGVLVLPCACSRVMPVVVPVGAIVVAIVVAVAPSACSVLWGAVAKYQ